MKGEWLAYLGRYPVLAVGHLGLEHTLGPGRDVTIAVVCIALEHQLALAFLTWLQSSKGHAIC